MLECEYLILNGYSELLRSFSSIKWHLTKSKGETQKVM